MGAEEEVENKKKLDEQRRTLQKQMQETDQFTDMDQMFQEWKEGYRRLRRRETNSCRNTRGCRKGLKRCQVIQDKKRNLLKEACACDEEMRKVGEEISERESRYLELSNKSTNNRMAVEEGGRRK